jgi:hypothetical protein
MEHALGQCACGQYHLSMVTPFTSTSTPPVPYGVFTGTTISTWQDPERITSYEGRHRSE